MQSSKSLNIPIFRGIQAKLCITINVFFFCTFVLLIAYCRAGDIKNSVEIEYGYPDQSIFVATINDKGKPDTPMTLIAEALMKRAELSWNAVPYPARRLFDNLKNGTTNFSILVRASSLLDSCIFSKNPIYTTKLNIYYIGNKLPVTSKEGLIGKHIITIRGYSYGGLLKFISEPDNQIINEVASTHKAAFEMLNDNRADYLLDYASAADDILSEIQINGVKSTPISQLNIYLVLSKSYPGAENLMIKLEKIAARLDVNEILTKKRK